MEFLAVQWKETRSCHTGSTVSTSVVEDPQATQHGQNSAYIYNNKTKEIKEKGKMFHRENLQFHSLKNP